MAYAEEILEAAQKLSVPAQLLSSKQATLFKTTLFQLLDLSPDRVNYLWQNLESKQSQSMQDAGGWRHIAEHVQDHPSLVFFDREDDLNVVYLKSTEQFTEILEDCTGFVFYVLAIRDHQLFAFNDHDFLIQVHLSSSNPDWAQECIPAPSTF